MTERFDEILKKSPFNQHTDEFLIKLEDMNEITKIVQELEELNRILSSDKSMFIEELVREQQQNKRYREALNSIMTLWKYSEDRTDFEWLAHKMSDEARKALERDLE